MATAWARMTGVTMISSERPNSVRGRNRFSSPVCSRRGIGIGAAAVSVVMVLVLVLWGLWVLWALRRPRQGSGLNT
ncbi:hypothetical protein GCM10022293_59540 [Azospirillum formosense]